jgi:hypothetical protein
MVVVVIEVKVKEKKDEEEDEDESSDEERGTNRRKCRRGKPAVFLLHPTSATKKGQPTCTSRNRGKQEQGQSTAHNVPVCRHEEQSKIQFPARKQTTKMTMSEETTL